MDIWTRRPVNPKFAARKPRAVINEIGPNMVVLRLVNLGRKVGLFRSIIRKLGTSNVQVS